MGKIIDKRRKRRSKCKITKKGKKPLAEDKTDALTVSNVTGIITPPNN